VVENAEPPPVSQTVTREIRSFPTRAQEDEDMSADLELVAKRAATWSETANLLKARLDLARWIVFALSIAGALAAAIASQFLPEGAAPTSALPQSHAVFATLGAVLLAAATFLSSRLLRDTEL
jgi:hypothetical protein